MGFLNLVKFLTRRAIEVLIILSLILFLPKVPPDAKFSTPYTVAPIQPFEGGLTLNTKLEKTLKWHKGDLHGPEAFADRDGVLYASLKGGDVVKFVGQEIVPVAKFGKPCKAFFEEKVCGRPLGMDFDKSGFLYVCDGYYGLYKVDVKTGKSEQLVAYGEIIKDSPVTLPNALAVSENGDVFWSDSSTQFDLQNGIFDLLADGSGRLIHYNAKTKKNVVLISNLRFANGVALADDESFVLVGESFMNRIHRYWLKGPKQGTHDVFVDGLPGTVDNLKQDGKGGFLVPLIVSIDDANPMYINYLGPIPIARRLIAKILGLIEFGFKFGNELYPNDFSKHAIYSIGHFEPFNFLYPKRASVLRIAKDGQIVDSLHSLNGELTGISEAHVFGDMLYLGSPFNDFVGKIPLSDIGWEQLSKNKVPITQTQKPGKKIN